jgi:type II secretion system protein G
MIRARFGQRPSRYNGFTLIELLIVIAIILILIAIALPNFLEAQIRARVTKAKSELRTIATAQEMYFLDFKLYPPENEASIQIWGHWNTGLVWLTSPIRYLASGVPEDPFGVFHVDKADSTVVTYESGGVETAAEPCRQCLVTWVFWSKGPDGEQGIWADNPHYGGDVRNYSPTNGTKSTGSIYYWGGDSQFIGMSAQTASQNRQFVYANPLNVDGQKYVRRMPPF